MTKKKERYIACSLANWCQEDTPMKAYRRCRRMDDTFRSSIYIADITDMPDKVRIYPSMGVFERENGKGTPTGKQAPFVAVFDKHGDLSQTFEWSRNSDD